MSEFKRYDGLYGSVPQRFIDENLPTCPFCGTTSPYWTLTLKMGWLNRYLFKCCSCQAILSTTAAAITGVERTPVTTLGLAKLLSGKKLTTIYMTIDHLGASPQKDLKLNQEYALESLQQIAKER